MQFNSFYCLDRRNIFLVLSRRHYVSFFYFDDFWRCPKFDPKNGEFDQTEKNRVKRQHNSSNNTIYNL